MSMKKILTSIFVVLATTSLCFAGFIADIGISWKENPANEFVTKYTIYQAKLPSTNFVPVVSALATNVAKVRVTSVGTYLFKVSAVNGLGESGLSQGVQVPNVSPSIPTNVAVFSVTVTNTP